MKKAIIILAVISALCGTGAAALWMLSSPDMLSDGRTERFRLSEGLRLAVRTQSDGVREYFVENGKDDELFTISLQGCDIDSRYRNGRLRFREQETGREGYIDRRGNVTFVSYDTLRYTLQEDHKPIVRRQERAETAQPKTAATASKATRISEADLQSMASDNPFYKEAQKILTGKVKETDARQRRTILNYCEHLRTAYTTRDIDFLRQVFSEKALIIVGTIVKTSEKQSSGMMAADRVEYNIRTKSEYLDRLQKVFSANKRINMEFSDFRILRHPTREGIYGVSLKQRYQADKYSDEGHLFLLWDFRNKAMPLIHVRTWQPLKDGSQEIISLEHFNLK